MQDTTTYIWCSTIQSGMMLQPSWLACWICSKHPTYQQLEHGSWIYACLSINSTEACFLVASSWDHREDVHVTWKFGVSASIVTRMLYEKTAPVEFLLQPSRRSASRAIHLFWYVAGVSSFNLFLLVRLLDKWYEIICPHARHPFVKINHYCIITGSFHLAST